MVHFLTIVQQVNGFSMIPGLLVGTYAPIKRPPLSPDITPGGGGHYNGHVYKSTYNSIQKLKDAVYHNLNNIFVKSN